jgi:hypothetical protein
MFRMTTVIRPPPFIVLLHRQGADVDRQVRHLSDAGLLVAAVAVSEDATAFDQVLAYAPDLVVLDFESNGPTVDLLKQDPRTKRIPVISLAILVPRRFRIDKADDSGARRRRPGLLPSHRSAWWLRD